MATCTCGIPARCAERGEAYSQASCTTRSGFQLAHSSSAAGNMARVHRRPKKSRFIRTLAAPGSRATMSWIRWYSTGSSGGASRTAKPASSTAWRAVGGSRNSTSWPRAAYERATGSSGP